MKPYNSRNHRLFLRYDRRIRSWIRTVTNASGAGRPKKIRIRNRNKAFLHHLYAIGSFLSDNMDSDFLVVWRSIRYVLDPVTGSHHADPDPRFSCLQREYGTKRESLSFTSSSVVINGSLEKSGTRAHSTLVYV
jgi:hypothetical protein